MLEDVQCARMQIKVQECKPQAPKENRGEEKRGNRMAKGMKQGKEGELSTTVQTQ